MPETIGQRLKQAREARRLTLEKAAEATRIRPQYVQALENDDYSVMSSAAQGRGFLRLYADFLGLNLDEIVSGIKSSAEQTPPPSAVPAPEMDVAPAPATATPAEPASAPTLKEGRPGFWSRLLRRSTPATAPVEETQPEPEPQPEPIVAPVIIEEPVVAPAPVIVDEAPAEDETVKPVRKPRAKRPTSDTEPKKPRTPRSAASKKKRSISLI
jgi:cytoskeletal protein RodZ